MSDGGREVPPHGGHRAVCFISPALRLRFPVTERATPFLYSPLFFPDGDDSDPLKVIFAFKDIVQNFTWVHCSNHKR